MYNSLHWQKGLNIWKSHCKYISIKSIFFQYNVASWYLYSNTLEKIIKNTTYYLEFFVYRNLYLPISWEDFQSSKPEEHTALSRGSHRDTLLQNPTVYTQPRLVVELLSPEYCSQCLTEKMNLSQNHWGFQ